MLASVTEVFAVYPIKSRNAAEQEATQCSTVIFLPRKFANDSSFGKPKVYTPRDCASQSLQPLKFTVDEGLCCWITSGWQSSDPVGWKAAKFALPHARVLRFTLRRRDNA